ncbi:MAG: hypothetical protein ACR65O_04325 [Methylomicrobium sp.]
MIEMRKADPKARRQALRLVLAGGIVGGVSIIGVANLLDPLQEALLSEPNELKRRLRIGFILMAAVSALPLGGFAMYLWRLGARVCLAGEYPPPGCRLIRDTPLLRGNAGLLRARALKTAALALLAAIGLLCLLFWRLFEAFGM